MNALLATWVLLGITAGVGLLAGIIFCLAVWVFVPAGWWMAWALLAWTLAMPVLVVVRAALE